MRSSLGLPCSQVTQQAALLLRFASQSLQHTQWPLLFNCQSLVPNGTGLLAQFYLEGCRVPKLAPPCNVLTGCPYDKALLNLASFL